MALSARSIKVDPLPHPTYPGRMMLPLALPFPEISPELISFPLFGMTFAIRWYALAYIAGILIGWRLVAQLLRRPALWPGDKAPMDHEQLEAFLTWAILGVIIGGRLGFVLFYNPSVYLADPLAVLRLWDGGMAFHGGLLGVVVAAILFARRHGVPMGSLADALALATPPGLFLGRIANFINAELWGRPTEAPWGVTFPTMCQDSLLQGCPVEGDWFYYGTEVPRHPSQLYESALEGLVLGIILMLLAYRGGLKRPGLLAGLFFAGYGAARMFVELFREADRQFITAENPLGHVVALGPVGLTMGQLLSLPMLLGGLLVVALVLRRRT